MSSLVQFHHFPALPVELRLKTWKYLLPPPRNLPVSYNSRTGRYETTHASKTNLQLLHTCAESRSLFLETYTLLTLNPSHASTIYINFNIDTLFFHDLECSPTGDLSHDFAMSPDKDKIQHIAIDSCLWEVLRAFKFESLAEIGQLCSLKSVALVMVHESSRVDIRDTRTPSFWSVRELESWREEVRHVSLFLEQLRSDVEGRPEGSWRTGRPAITMWLC